MLLSQSDKAIIARKVKQYMAEGSHASVWGRGIDISRDDGQSAATKLIMDTLTRAGVFVDGD